MKFLSRPGAISPCDSECFYIDTVNRDRSERIRHFQSRRDEVWETLPPPNNIFVNQHVEPALDCDIAVYYHDFINGTISQWTRDVSTGEDLTENWVIPYAPIDPDQTNNVFVSKSNGNRIVIGYTTTGAAGSLGLRVHNFETGDMLSSNLIPFGIDLPGARYSDIAAFSDFEVASVKLCGSTLESGFGGGSHFAISGVGRAPGSWALDRDGWKNLGTYSPFFTVHDDGQIYTVHHEQGLCSDLLGNDYNSDDRHRIIKRFSFEDNGNDLAYNWETELLIDNSSHDEAEYSTLGTPSSYCGYIYMAHSAGWWRYRPDVNSIEKIPSLNTGSTIWNVGLDGYHTAVRAYVVADNYPGGPDSRDPDYECIAGCGGSSTEAPTCCDLAVEVIEIAPDPSSGALAVALQEGDPWPGNCFETNQSFVTFYIDINGLFSPGCPDDCIQSLSARIYSNDTFNQSVPVTVDSCAVTDLVINCTSANGRFWFHMNKSLLNFDRCNYLFATLRSDAGCEKTEGFLILSIQNYGTASSSFCQSEPE